jgi:putative spermidine/putrescine transport system permease protein
MDDEAMSEILQRAGFRALVWALYAFLLAPLVCVVIVSFNREPIQSFPPTGLTLHWYAFALQVESFVRGSTTSFLVALGSTLIATPIAVAAAVGLWRGTWRGKAALEAFFLSPIVVPGLVIGISLLVALAAIDVREAPVRLLAGHVLIVMPYVIRTTLASLSRLDQSLEEAAETLGASRWQAFLHVILPLIRPGVVAGMIFGFILSFDDVNVSLFLVDARTTTLPIAIMSYLQYSFDPSVAAISSMLIFVTILLAIVLEWTFGLKRLFAGQ